MMNSNQVECTVVDIDEWYTVDESFPRVEAYNADNTRDSMAKEVIEDAALLEQSDAVPMNPDDQHASECSAQIQCLSKKGTKLVSDISTSKQFIEEKLADVEARMCLTETSLATIRASLERVTANVKKVQNYVELLEKGDCLNC